MDYKKMTCICLFVFALTGGIFAESYCYLALESKDKVLLEREVESNKKSIIERWEGGKVLYSSLETSGFVKKKYSAKIVFAGKDVDIKGLLLSVPYETDLLEAICGVVVYRSVSGNSGDHRLSELRVNFKDIKDALEFAKNNSRFFWDKLKKENSEEYGRHGSVQKEVRVDLYNRKVDEPDRLFSIKIP